MFGSQWVTMIHIRRNARWLLRPTRTTRSSRPSFQSPNETKTFSTGSLGYILEHLIFCAIKVYFIYHDNF